MECTNSEARLDALKVYFIRCINPKQIGVCGGCLHFEREYLTAVTFFGFHLGLTMKNLLSYFLEQGYRAFTAALY
jgi:hypothetical protein